MELFTGSCKTIWYIYKNKFSDKQLNIDAFISILKVKY